MRHFIFNLLFLLGTFATQAQQETIEWKHDRKLQISDFKAQPPADNPYAANINSGLSFSWGITHKPTGKELTYSVTSEMYPEESWIKASKNTEYLLAHEQTHFNISELFARKLRKSLAEYQPNGNVETELKNMYRQIEKKRRQLQNKFDEATDHSENMDEEHRWRSMIQKELDSLADFQ